MKFPHFCPAPTLYRKIIFAGLRLVMGGIFFWAFIDKLFGLGFATVPEDAWLAGGSPTYGFLTYATKGPFAEIFQAMAGNLFVDWLFMIGLLGIGLALLLGVGTKIAGYSGALMMILMYLAALPPEHHPFLDDHIAYAFVLLLLPQTRCGYAFSLHHWWSKLKFVKKHPWLI